MHGKQSGQPMVNANNCGKHLRAYEKKLKYAMAQMESPAKERKESKAHEKRETKAYEKKEHKLASESKQEKKEHPWVTKKQATRIAKDHMRKGK